MPYQKVLSFFLSKIIIGLAIIAGLVIFAESFGRPLLDKIALADPSKHLIIAILNSALAVAGYILLFRIYEKRAITELSMAGFGKNTTLGLFTGFALQSLIILVIYITGMYSVIRYNPVSFLLSPFAMALAAGFVTEIMIRGIFFRLVEEKLGTIITILLLTVIFALLHSGMTGATALSISATAMQAGALGSAVYVFTRSLWSTIFLHFAWDFAEPGIFGGINPGITINQSFITSEITGPAFLTGGVSGPQNSIQGLLFCFAATLIFLWLAYKKNNVIGPSWKSEARSQESEADKRTLSLCSSVCIHSVLCGWILKRDLKYSHRCIFSVSHARPNPERLTALELFNQLNT